MFTLYGLKGSRSTRIAWLLEELNLPYTLELFSPPDLAQGKFPETLKKFSPTGEVPALRLENGKVLVESSYIIQYLLEKHGKGSELEARDENEREAVQMALYTSEGNFMTDTIVLTIHKFAADTSPVGVSFLLRQLFAYIDSKYAGRKLAGYLEQLSKQVAANGTFLVGGHLSGADIAYGWALEFAFDKGGIDPARYPILQAYLESLAARPAHQAAMLKHAQAPIHA